MASSSSDLANDDNSSRISPHVPPMASQMGPYMLIKSRRHGNHTYRPGKTAEFADGSFLRIHTVCFFYKHHDVFLCGDHLVRVQWEDAMIPYHRNELVWRCSSADPVASRVARRLDQAIRIRRVNFTNLPYAVLNTTRHANTFRNPIVDWEIGELWCRLMRVQIVTTMNRILEDSISTLAAEYAYDKYRTDERLLRDGWRAAPVTAGGSYADEQQVLTLDGVHETMRVQKYTYGDAFCGAGGMTRGADMAGLHPVFGFDIDQSAINTYAANFRRKGTLCLKESVDVFLSRVSRLESRQRLMYMVDVLHISPPCQYFSPARTVPNAENDAKNEIVIFSVQQILQTLKPRVVTLEETFGLVSYWNHFCALINIFVTMGYSVRWKICSLEHWGVPQKRKRLLFIAAGPGERLPPFPKETHGHGLRRFVTIRDTLDLVTPPVPRHEKGKWPKPPYSPDRLSGTITCSGGQFNYHPSGMRHYTIREMARLQTFPSYHVFPSRYRTASKKQIGNAVPPLMGKAMFREIIKVLKETDETSAAAAAALPALVALSVVPGDFAEAAGAAEVVEIARVAETEGYFSGIASAAPPAVLTATDVEMEDAEEPAAAAAADDDDAEEPARPITCASM